MPVLVDGGVGRAGETAAPPSSVAGTTGRDTQAGRNGGRGRVVRRAYGRFVTGRRARLSAIGLATAHRYITEAADVLQETMTVAATRH